MMHVPTGPDSARDVAGGVDLGTITEQGAEGVHSEDAAVPTMPSSSEPSQVLLLIQNAARCVK